MSQPHDSSFFPIALFFIFGLAGVAALGWWFLQEDDENERDEIEAEDDQLPLELTEVEVALGYFPNAQFIPFYVALEQEYFRDQNLQARFDHSFVDDIIGDIATARSHFAITDGDAVITAQGQDIPVRSILAYYQETPNAIASLGTNPIEITQIENQSIGLPGLFGASYLSTLAYFDALQINQVTTDLEPIGFNQIESLSQNQVDLAVIFANNESVVMTQQGIEHQLVRYDEAIDFVGSSVITSEALLQEEAAVAQAFVRALQQGLEYTVAFPDEAFQISLEYIEVLTAEEESQQREIFEATLPMWELTVNQTLGTGAHDALIWQSTYDFLLRKEFVVREYSLAGTAYTNDFIPQVGDLNTIETNE